MINPLWITGLPILLCVFALWFLSEEARGGVPGNGEYLQRCKRCDMFTCYDLEPMKARSDEAPPVL